MNYCAGIRQIFVIVIFLTIDRPTGKRIAGGAIKNCLEYGISVLLESERSGDL